MPNLGMGELLIVLAIVMLVFGATRLPQIGEGVGKAIRNLKRGLSDDDNIEVTPEDKRVERRGKGAERVSGDRAADDRVSDAEVVER